jgi:hypothetical protein
MIVGRLRGLRAARSLKRRSSSTPNLQEGYRKSTTRKILRKLPFSRSSGDMLSSDSDADVSSYADSTDYTESNPVEEDGIALSEIAVEEHVPDIITQA